jgi:hypothetical protein
MVVAPEAIRGCVATFYRLNFFSASPFYLCRIAHIFFSSFIHVSAIPFSAVSEMSKTVTLIGLVIHKGPRKVTHK